ncbi:MAG: glycosyltransferase family 2 protein [Lentisphaerae bacterium]|nr:glycosyltransferase family 2 protein [Lentisphaerota bacterium]
MSTNHNYCVVLPAYNEQAGIGCTVSGIRRHCKNVVVVDDGSSDATASEAEKSGAFVLRHETNKGKGAALNTGFKHALDRNYEFVITMDSDGQHDPDDLAGFIEEYDRSGTPVLIGNRMGQNDGMPFVRKMTNLFMSSLLSRKMKQAVPDTQSGYRLYRKDVLPIAMCESSGFAAESEVLLNIAAQGIRIGSVPIKVIYGNEQSKIRTGRDTVRFFSMLWRYGNLEDHKRQGN